MAMKIYEKRTGQVTRKVAEVWLKKLVSHHEKVVLSSEGIRELESGLEVGKLLELSYQFSFSRAHLTDFIVSHKDRALRPLAQVM